MNRIADGLKSRPMMFYALAMAAIFGIAFFLRVYFAYDNVFAGDWVRFQINDPYYHMRLVENLVYHFPHLISFDPYLFYPGGQDVPTAPFYDLLLGFFIWLFGAGSPSKSLIDGLGAYFPAILGALTTIPVYFVGRELFNRKAGIIAALLIAILPGQYLMRTLLGFTDHHAAEALFSTLAVMFLLLAVNSARGKGITFDSVRTKDWASLRKPLLYSLAGGVALAVYLLSWTGGGLFVFIFFVFAVLQYVIDHWKGNSTDYLCIVGVPAFLIALILIAPAAGGYTYWNLQVASLVIGIIAFILLSGISRLVVRRDMKPAVFPAALVLLGGVGLGFFYLIDPALLESIFDKLGVFRPTGGYLTIAEVKGITAAGIWDNFTTTFYLSILSIGVLIIWHMVIKKETAPGRTLLLVWSLVVMIATFGQMRFAYYFAVNAALLTAYLSWRILEFAGFEAADREAVPEQADRSPVMLTAKQRPKLEQADRTVLQPKKKTKPSKKEKRKKEKARAKEPRRPVSSYFSARYVNAFVALVIVFFLAVFPNIGKAVDWAEPVRGATDDWQATLAWMGNSTNTPDPFPDPDFFYARYDEPAPGEVYEYPDSAYGVMSWWDYGYWITYIAHRMPNANPGRKVAQIPASFFTAGNESSANDVLDRAGSRYVIIDSDMATGKYYAMIEWAGKDETDFYEVFYEEQSGRLIPELLYHPLYYESMCSRLYNFGAEAWEPPQTALISWEPRWVTDSGGNRLQVKVITDRKTFDAYNEALVFLEAHPDYEVVGSDRFLSPVPLEKLEHFELKYKSPTAVLKRGNETVSRVEIFEYSP